MTEKEMKKAFRLLSKGRSFYICVTAPTYVYRSPSPSNDIITVLQPNAIHSVCEVVGSFGRIPGVGWFDLSNASFHVLTTIGSVPWMLGRYR